MATIAILGTLDSKADEHSFVADRIRDCGHAVALIDFPETITSPVFAQACAKKLLELISRSP